MEPAYGDYFDKIPEVLNKFDHLIFYASDYRDINLVKQHGIKKLSIIPNGASEIEFSKSKDKNFRSRHSIAEDSFVFLTVGSFTGLKGHSELAQAFQELILPAGKNAVLILNGNDTLRASNSISSLPMKFISLLRTYGSYYTLRHALKSFLRRLDILVGKSVCFKDIALSINQQSTQKKVLVTNFGREDLVQAYMSSDLFVFASNIEYSPLVLFESVAAGLPFLSVEVGNSVEISKWTEGGEICPSVKDSKGYTRVSPKVLAEKMSEMMANSEKLRCMSIKGKLSWEQRFTWSRISAEYEKVFEYLLGINN